MLEHLINADLEPVVCETEPEGLVRLSPTSSSPRDKAPMAGMVLDAQCKTADWLESTGLTGPAIHDEASAAMARDAFAAISTGQPDNVQTERLLALTMPDEVRHLVGMLTAYDWEFVHQAKELRGFVVAKLLEEATSAGKAGDRIKALTALGKVTEVGLFTEKVEVKAAPQTDEELDARIKERIAKLRGVQDALAAPIPITDAEPKA